MRNLLLNSWNSVSTTIRLTSLVLLVLFFFYSSAWAQQEDNLVNPAIAKKAVMDLLPNIPSSLTEQGLSVEDLVQVNDPSNSTRLVEVSLNEAGQVVPNQAWHQSHPSFCRSLAREPGQAKQVLEFKIHKLVEKDEGFTRSQFAVFARTMDAQTRIISKQVEADSSTGQHQSTIQDNPDFILNETIQEAYQQLGVRLDEVDGGCGEIHLAHISGSTVEDEFTFEVGFQNESASHLQYAWDFGDGNQQTSSGRDQVARQTYDKEGEYTVQVQVTGDEVESGQASLTVTVKEEEEDEEKDPIQPLSGIWNGKLVKHEMTGCSGQVRQGVDSQLQGLINTTLSQQRFDFQQPFHPKPLMQKSTVPLTWQQISLNGWKAVLTSQRTQYMNADVTIYAQPRSSRLIAGQVHTDLRVSGPGAKIIGSHCQSFADFEWQLQEES